MTQRSIVKIMSIVGARPNFMKVASIARAIEKHNASKAEPAFEHLIVHTGQHYDDRMSAIFFEQLGLPKPHINLSVGSSSHAVQTSEIMRRFEPVLLEHCPHFLILVGDVNSTIACALVAAKIDYSSTQSSALCPQRSKGLRPLIVHVEAGLRSFDRNMPEEVNRVLTDALSDLLFVTEEAGVSNLTREGISGEKIHLVGNVMIDTLMAHLGMIPEPSALSLPDELPPGYVGKEYGLVTLHRPSNVDAPETLGALIECLKAISSRLRLLFPVHPRTRSNLEQFGFAPDLSGNNGIILTRPLGYLEFLWLLKSARLVLTDSGGIQEETTALGIPCITLRENTERPVTVSRGTNYLVGSDPDKILKAAYEVLDGRGKKGEVPPLWDGKAGQRIVETLVNCLPLTAY